MIHFDLRELSYHICFDEACYYPILSPQDQDIHVLFGLSYGFSLKNSLNIGWRPSERFLDKIDLFACIFYKGNQFLHYIYTVDIKQEYDFRIVASPKHKFVGIEGYKMKEDQTADRIFKFSEHYFYPSIRVGTVYKSKGSFNILLERN